MAASRRLAAILAADVAGYSRLMGADEEGTLARLKAVRSRLTDPQIAAHNGRIVKTTGDGLLAEFPSTVDALRCASEIQVRMPEQNAGTAPDSRIALRIGIHQGDIVVEDGDIFGDGVNIAARLEGLAELGGICVSARVQEDAAGKLDLAFRDLGEQQLKNIARTVHVYAVGPSAARLDRGRRWIGVRATATASILLVAIMAAGAWWTWHGASPSATSLSAASTAILPSGEAQAVPRLSIVVLPFANLSNDPEQEYLADAVTDGLITDLSWIANSFVVARTTAFTYKGKAADVKQIGRDLGVRYVLEGSVRKLGERVQVNVQLLDGETGSHVWADRFDTDRGDLAEAQSEITGRLARMLNFELVRDVGRRIEQEHAANPDARDLVMRARSLAIQTNSAAADNRPAMRRATIDLLERALVLDPGSVDARIQIANILANDVADGFSNSIDQDEARAERLILEALEREPNSSWARTVIGVLRRVQGRWAESQAELEAAVALDQNNAHALRELGQTVLLQGKSEAAIPYLDQAIRLDLRNPNIFVGYANLGRCQLYLNRIDEAVGLFRKARALAPGIWWVHIGLASSLGLRGVTDEAQREIAEALKIKPDANSIARLRAIETTQGLGSPQMQALQEKTAYAGLRRAGFPED